MRFLFIACTIFFGLLHIQSYSKTQCKKIRFSTIGWTDITASTAIASEILQLLGYETKTINLSLPMTFASLKNNDVDIFLGNWMPTMKADITPYQNQGSIETIGTVLKGAKYTLAVPKYVFDAGVKSFKDLHKHKDKFQGKIYGLEPGNDGNRIISNIIQGNNFNLKNWKLVESSEQAMLMEVLQSAKRNKWIVFLGWEPHPMNKMIQISYLTDGDLYFGPHEGGATVYINSRKNYSKECPEISKFFSNFNLSIEDEYQMMNMIIDQNISPNIAAKKWIKNNINKVEKFLVNIKKSNSNYISIDELKTLIQKNNY